jgi:ketopantoate reductase
LQLTIIGAGAIGGTIGAHLIRDGHDILLCDADPAHVAAINERGLTITGPVENFTVPATAVLPDGLPASLSRAAIAVKSHHTAAAAELLRAASIPAATSSPSRTAGRPEPSPRSWVPVAYWSAS